MIGSADLRVVFIHCRCKIRTEQVTLWQVTAGGGLWVINRLRHAGYGVLFKKRVLGGLW